MGFFDFVSKFRHRHEMDSQSTEEAELDVECESQTSPIELDPPISWRDGADVDRMNAWIKYETDITKRYFSDIEKIHNAKGLQDTLDYCEISLQKNYPDFISLCKKEGVIPPVIPCRDTLLWGCTKLGDWERLDKAIEILIRCEGFSYMKPDKTSETGDTLVTSDGTEEKAMYAQTKEIFTAAYEYVLANPGTLQSKIYDVPEMKCYDREILKSFCRNSKQIKKVKEGKQNLLYAVENPYKRID